MIDLFNTLLYQPVLNVLVYFYNVLPGNDIGLAIIALTILIKLILLPLSMQSIKSQKAMQEIQPKLEALKKELKDDKEKLAAETMKLYKSQKVNPLSSCLPLIIQFPFLIAVYQAFRIGLTSEHLELIYPFVHNPGQINPTSFGLVNLAVPNIILAVLAGGAQFVQTKMLSTKKPEKKTKGSKDEGALASMNKSMLYFMPFMTIFIGTRLPGGLTLYWLLTTVLTVVQQKILFSRMKDDKSLIEGEIVSEVAPKNLPEEKKKDK
jgi:YidC/Oxa1 family membrane protein insertase